MIIFGVSSKVIQLAMLNLICGFCGNPSAHALRKRLLRFSLFFIPLFPVAPAKYSMQCTFCGAATDLSKGDAEQLLAQGPGGPDGAQQQAPPVSGNPYAGGEAPKNPYRS